MSTGWCRYAIGRVLGLKDAAKVSDEDVARLPRHVTALLVKVSNNKKALAARRVPKATD